METEWTDGVTETTSLAEQVEKMIQDIAKELREAHSFKYDVEKAERTAAQCLEAQRLLAEFLSEAEIFSKERKLEVERLSGEKWFYHKANYEGKTTEATLEALVAKDEDVVAAKKEQYKSEADYRKWLNLLNVLKEAHLYYRNLSRGKNDWS